jgi:EpsI family protein
MNGTLWKWAPGSILLLGALATIGGTKTQQSMPLIAPLETTVFSTFEGLVATDVEVSAEEQRIAGMSNYVMRVFAEEGAAEDAAAFSIYVGYYERQIQGKTIHSPRNCLPGGGWEPLTHSRELIATPIGQVPVNRYLIGNGAAKALVFYWYQGRGRVEANEYLVKWNLLRDQALYGRSDEALVRIIVPVTESGEEEAFLFASRVASELAPAVARAIPG